MNRFKLSILSSFASVAGVFANVQDSLVVKIDSARIDVKEFSETLSEKYTGSDFNYDVAEGEAENLISRFLRWFLRKIGDLFGFDVGPGMITFIKIFFYGGLAVLVIYIVIKLLVGEGSSSLFSRNNKAMAPLNIQEEHIENIDLDAYIKEALEQKNYRLAIRYMFLKSLKELSMSNAIDWHFDKTNSDYYNELESDALKAGFKQAAYLYDNIWYGEFELDAQGFAQAKKDFDTLEKLTQNAR